MNTTLSAPMRAALLRLGRAELPWAGRIPVAGSAIALGVAALAARALGGTPRSAYLDEATFILTGRILLDRHAEYAAALSWTYGSYLWSIVAGLADAAGGLNLVRLIVAVLGAVMAAATAVVAARLAPDELAPWRGWIALIAGGTMAFMPTAIALGRWGTYDALAGAAFMSGVALLVPPRPLPDRRALLAAAACLFAGFLAKYVVAAFFPFVCCSLFAVQPTRREARRSVVWFSAPLAAACAGYILLFRGQIESLLTFSTTYGDLSTASPLVGYTVDHPELWVLLLVAALGWPRASALTRGFTTGGMASLILFQATARPDVDWWKHSVYVVFFLAPLASTVAFEVGRGLLQPRGRWMWSSPVIALGIVGLLVAGVRASEERADGLVAFYPDLSQSVDAIRAYAANARFVLTDDDPVRYYLYGEVPVDRVVNGYYVSYCGVQGLDGYAQAIADQRFDLIVFDGGIGRLAAQLTEDLGARVDRFYREVDTRGAGVGRQVRIYEPRGDLASGPPARASLSSFFDTGCQGWGAHPDGANQQPSLDASVSRARPWRGHATLAFAVSPGASLVSVKRHAEVSRVRATVFLQPTSSGARLTNVGIVGFDGAWGWHDDGFRQIVPTGQWVDLEWRLDRPAVFREIGVKLDPASVSTAYIGHVQLDP